MAGTTDPAELRRLQFFDSLPDDLVASIANIAETAEFPPNTTIFREGTENHVLYVVSAGLVSLEMNVPRRGTVRILTVGPGDVLAWSAVLQQGRSMTATAVALEPTKAVALSAPRLFQLFESNYELGYRFHRQLAIALSQRLAGTRLQLLDLFAETTPHEDPLAYP